MRFVFVSVVCVLLMGGCSPEKAAVSEDSTAVEEPKEQDLALVEFDTPPQPIEQVAPDYPDDAKGVATGTTHVEVLVDEAGQVQETRVVQSSSHEMLDEAAEIAASQWVFEPAMLDGKPVPAKVIIPFQFKMH
jgi:TonB family protein